MKKILGFAATLSLSAAAFAAVQNSSAYVQRGLVAHWDAIDNAGVGQHDASATTWKDLTGNGFDWTLSGLGTDFSWADGSISMSGTRTTPVGMVSGKSYTDLKGKIVTMEFIFKAADVRSSVIFSTGVKTVNAIKTSANYDYTGIRTYKTEKMVGLFHEPTSDSGGKEMGYYFTAGTVSSCQAIFSGNGTPDGISSLTVDGASHAVDKISNTFGMNTDICLGNRNTGSSYPFKGELMTIRIYSCRLSSSDLALNHAVDRVRFFGEDPADVVPDGYEVDKNGNFVKKIDPNPMAKESPFDDVKVWFRGAAGNAVGTADNGGSNVYTWWNCGKMRSVVTQGSATGGPYDGASYNWWGWRVAYDNDFVRMPYANVSLGESPCMIYPAPVTTNGTADVSIGGETMSRPVISFRAGGMRMTDWMSDWPSGSVCSNYTCVLRFKPGEPINPVSGGNNTMPLIRLNASYSTGNPTGGISVNLNSPRTLCDTYVLRFFVGDQQTNLTASEIRRDSWVDLAIIVESPKLTILMSYEDGEGESRTNALCTYTRTYSSSEAKPAMSPSVRLFALGSTGSTAGSCTFTNGVSSSTLNAAFRGSFHQVAFWDRTLSLDEAKEAMGRPSLVSVGLNGNAGNLEFAATKHEVSAEGDWDALDPVLNANNLSATVNFTCSAQYAGLPQFLRVRACADSEAGAVTATLNGHALGQLAMNPGEVAHLYAGKGLVVQGNNQLVLTYANGGALKIDAVTVGGSWQYGLDVKDEGIGMFGRDRNNLHGCWFNPSCGNDRYLIRGITNDSGSERCSVLTYVFRVPEDLVGSCKGVLRFRSQNTGGSTYTNDVYVNGTKLARLGMKDKTDYDVKVPAKLLTSGWNKVEMKRITGWVNFDCHQFTIQPHVDGQLIILR